MSDNRTTELREKLRERGVEYEPTKFSTLQTTFTANGVEWIITEREATGELFVEPRHGLTPEQAIAATLGSGTLTAEQVREAIERNFGKVAVIDDGGEKVEWREGWVCNVGFNLQAIADELNAKLGSEINGDTSDGYHTFNELYHHRAVLFSVIVRDHRELAWKARKHHDGTMYDGMFIVGIETPKGQATYHYDLDPYWEMFDCEEREYAPEWDGHTPDDAIARIAELGSGTCKITATATNNLMYPDYMTKWYELSCGHSLTLKGEEEPKWCAVCGKAVGR